MLSIYKLYPEQRTSAKKFGAEKDFWSMKSKFLTSNFMMERCLETIHLNVSHLTEIDEGTPMKGCLVFWEGVLVKLLENTFHLEFYNQTSQMIRNGKTFLHSKRLNQEIQEDGRTQRMMVKAQMFVSNKIFYQVFKMKCQIWSGQMKIVTLLNILQQWLSRFWPFFIIK